MDVFYDVHSAECIGNKCCALNLCVLCIISKMQRYIKNVKGENREIMTTIFRPFCGICVRFPSREYHSLFFRIFAFL